MAATSFLLATELNCDNCCIQTNNPSNCLTVSSMPLYHREKLRGYIPWQLLKFITSSAVLGKCTSTAKINLWKPEIQFTSVGESYLNSATRKKHQKPKISVNNNSTLAIFAEWFPLFSTSMRSCNNPQIHLHCSPLISWGSISFVGGCCYCFLMRQMWD